MLILMLMRRIVNAAIFLLLAITLASCLQPPTSGGLASPIGSNGFGSPNQAQMTYTPHPNPPPLQNATVDQSKSQALTTYLKDHRLPLVGAQVLEAPDGQRQVILFGYVASGYGKQDAENKVQTYLQDANVSIVNRITIQPELASSGASPSASPSGSSSASSSGSYYDPSLGNAQQYQQQSAQDPYSSYQSYQSQSSGPSMLSTIIPMLGIFGGSFGGGGMMGGPFGGFGTGYSPYGGYGYPAYPPSPGIGFGAPYPPYP